MYLINVVYITCVINLCYIKRMVLYQILEATGQCGKFKNLWKEMTPFEKNGIAFVPDCISAKTKYNKMYFKV